MPWLHAVRLFFVLLLGLGVTSLTAQNLIVDPDFDLGTEGWAPHFSDATGGLFWDESSDASDCPDSGAIRIDVTVEETGLAGVSTVGCISVSPGDTLGFRARVRHEDVCDVWLGVTKFYDADCQQTNEGIGFAQAPQGEGYVDAIGTVFVEDQVGVIHSMRANVEAYCALAGSTSIYLDKIYFGLEAQVFATDFESGTTCPWSDTVD